VGPYTCAKVRHDPPKGFISTHARLRTKSVYSVIFFSFWGFLQLAAAKAPGRILTQVRHNSRFRARMCLFGVSNIKSNIWTTISLHFSELAPISGPFLTDFENVRLKSLNNGDAPLRTPLNPHRRRINCIVFVLYCIVNRKVGVKISHAWLFWTPIYHRLRITCYSA